MAISDRVVPCLWFDSNAEEAVNFYIGIFPNSRIINITHYGEAGHEVHGRAAGSVLTVNFELDGVAFTAMNGGPVFRFSEALSLQIMCDTQAEIDRYWEQLSEGGDPAAQQCGWLKDKYGLSWQVTPRFMDEILGDGKAEPGQRAFAAMMNMKKLDIDALEKTKKGDKAA